METEFDMRTALLGAVPEPARLRDLALRATSTGPTTSSRTRSCGRSPTSTASSRARTSTPGSSPSCATSSTPSTASASARWRMRTAAMPRRSAPRREQHAHLDFEDLRSGAREARAGPARGAAPRRRAGLLLRGRRRDLRLRRRHHQEPREPRPQAPRRADVPRRERGPQHRPPRRGRAAGQRRPGRDPDALNRKRPPRGGRAAALPEINVIRRRGRCAASLRRGGRARPGAGHSSCRPPRR